jgi:hypothetical protein
MKKERKRSSVSEEYLRWFFEPSGDKSSMPLYVFMYVSSVIQIVGKIMPNFGRVRSTARYAIHLEFDISPNAFEIRVVQSSKWLIWRVVGCTFGRLCLDTFPLL